MSSGTDAPIMGDRDRLIQVLANLTLNACEAAPEGARITWKVSVNPGLETVSLEIENPGDPIPPQLMTRLTEPFFSTKPSGTGLGLAIVQRLTLIHGGVLSFSSAKSDGTSIRISFQRLDARMGCDEEAPTAHTRDP